MLLSLPFLRMLLLPSDRTANSFNPLTGKEEYNEKKPKANSSDSGTIVAEVFLFGNHQLRNRHFFFHLFPGDGVVWHLKISEVRMLT